MGFLITSRVAVALLLIASGGISPAAWAQCARGAEYEQTDAVKRRYPDPTVRFDTPAFAPGAAGFTTYEQMLAYLRGLSERSTSMFVSTAGYSQEGRVLPLLLFTNTGRFAPSELRRLERPIVLLVGQAHGNEP